MNKFTKVVNIYPTMPITGVNPPIRSVVKRVTKSMDEIRTCLMARARVEEILPNGEIVRLNIGNYDKCLNTTNAGKCDCFQCGQLVADNNVDEQKSAWQIAYENALAGKNLAVMSRKQRRSAEAAARAVADAAIATSEPEVVIGVANVEVVEETSEEVKEEVKVDNTVEETSEEVKEEEVKTIDIEELSSHVE